MVSHHLLNLVERDVLAVHQTDHLPVRQDTWTLKTDLIPCSLKYMLTTLTTTTSLLLMLTTLGLFCTSPQSSIRIGQIYPEANRFSDYTSRWVQQTENCFFFLPNIFLILFLSLNHSGETFSRIICLFNFYFVKFSVREHFNVQFNSHLCFHDLHARVMISGLPGNVCSRFLLSSCKVTEICLRVLLFHQLLIFRVVQVRAAVFTDDEGN